MKINTKIDKGNWIEWEDGVKFLLRPYPVSQMRISDKLELQMEQMLKMFKYCIINWEGLVGEDDNPIPCNDKMKQYMFDHFNDIRDFVSESITKSISAEDKELGN